MYRLQKLIQAGFASLFVLLAIGVVLNLGNHFQGSQRIVEKKITDTGSSSQLLKGFKGNYDCIDDDF